MWGVLVFGFFSFSSDLVGKFHCSPRGMYDLAGYELVKQRKALKGSLVLISVGASGYRTWSEMARNTPHKYVGPGGLI